MYQAIGDWRTEAGLKGRILDYHVIHRPHAPSTKRMTRNSYFRRPYGPYQKAVAFSRCHERTRRVGGAAEVENIHGGKVVGLINRNGERVADLTIAHALASVPPSSRRG